MVDYWGERIPLNPAMGYSKDAGTSMPAGTNGTVEGGINNTVPSDMTSKTIDISDDITTQDAPMNPTLSWGGIENPYSTGVPGTGR